MTNTDSINRIAHSQKYLFKLIKELEVISF